MRGRECRDTTTPDTVDTGDAERRQNTAKFAARNRDIARGDGDLGEWQSPGAEGGRDVAAAIAATAAGAAYFSSLQSAITIFFLVAPDEVPDGKLLKLLMSLTLTPKLRPLRGDPHPPRWGRQFAFRGIFKEPITSRCRPRSPKPALDLVNRRRPPRPGRWRLTGHGSWSCNESPIAGHVSGYRTE